jgi:hypothetical protein
MKPSPSSGIVTQQSNHSVDHTVLKLEELLRNKGVTIFAVIDHSETLHLRSPEGWNSAHARLPKFGHRSASENPRFGRQRRQGVDLLQ